MYVVSMCMCVCFLYIHVHTNVKRIWKSDILLTIACTNILDLLLVVGRLPHVRLRNITIPSSCNQTLFAQLNKYWSGAAFTILIHNIEPNVNGNWFVIIKYVILSIYNLCVLCFDISKGKTYPENDIYSEFSNQKFPFKSFHLVKNAILYKDINPTS